MRASAVAAGRPRLDRSSCPHGRPRRRPHDRSRTGPDFSAVTNAEYFYDYALQDPINEYDLDGQCAFACALVPAFGIPGVGQALAIGVGVAAIGYGGYRIYQATKSGGSGKPRTHNKRFKSKKEAREAAQRDTARNQQPDVDASDRHGPHFHAKTKAGKRKTKPKVHYKYPTFRSGR